MEILQTWMWAIWLSIFIFTLIIEALSTDLISVFFSVGSLVSLFLSLFPKVPWWVGIVVFVVVSLLSLLSLRPFLQKKMQREIVTSNIDSIIGEKGVLISKIDLLHHGKVKVHDVIWTAIASEENQIIDKGSVVVILAVSGNKLVVKETENDMLKKEGE